MTATARRRTWKAFFVVVVILALVYGGRVALLFMGATEGDVPTASAVPLPADAEILRENRDCASGGCWVVFTVLPPPGQSPTELAEEMRATPQLEMPGTFLDPRTIWIWAEPGNSELTLRADYFSGPWTP